jgi:hypothetical protein
MESIREIGERARELFGQPRRWPGSLQLTSSEGLIDEVDV